MRTHTSISRKDTRMYLKNNIKTITRIDDLHDHLFACGVSFYRIF